MELMNTHALETAAKMRQTLPLWVRKLPAAPVAQTWRDLARRLLDGQVNPQIYVTVSFTKAHPCLPLTPDELASPETIAAFDARAQLLRRSLNTELVNMLGHFDRDAGMAVSASTRRKEYEPGYPQLSDEAAWADVLDEVIGDAAEVDTDADADDEGEGEDFYNGDGDLGSLSALFRYCMASGISAESGTADRERFRGIAAYFKVAACLEYTRQAALYEATTWRKILPAGFAAEASRIYRSAINAG